eukprot:8702025-Pyramimonas_sp.AAC.1
MRDSWAILGSCWADLGPSLGASWAVLELYWRHLGPAWMVGNPEARMSTSLNNRTAINACCLLGGLLELLGDDVLGE